MRTAAEPHSLYGKTITGCRRPNLWRAKSLSATITALLLAGCGGGGNGDGGNGGGGEPPPPPPPPAENEPPMALAGCFTTLQRDILTGGLRAADRDNSANELTFSLDPATPNFAGPISTPRGTVQLLDTTSGEFTYMPNETGSRGVDTFTFRVDDPESFATGIETVIINPAIVPLGDSITEGILGDRDPPPAERIGYRGPLRETLSMMSFEIDLVGSQQGGQAAPVPIDDPDHEGYGGAHANDLVFGGRLDGDGNLISGIFSALEQNPADVTLLHIGTNDVNNEPAATTAAEINDILDEIERWELSLNGNPVTVLLAEIIERSPPESSEICDGCNANLTTLNNLIRGIPAARPGDDIVIVNQHDALVYPDDMTPQVRGGRTIFIHPNATGYGKMAATWLPGLVESGKLTTCE